MKIVELSDAINDFLDMFRSCNGTVSRNPLIRYSYGCVSGIDCNLIETYRGFDIVWKRGEASVTHTSYGMNVSSTSSEWIGNGIYVGVRSEKFLYHVQTYWIRTDIDRIDLQVISSPDEVINSIKYVTGLIKKDIDRSIRTKIRDDQEKVEKAARLAAIDESLKDMTGEQ
jgi:hypothetical protein